MSIEKALEYAAALESHDPVTLSLDEWRIVKLAAALRSAREDGARLDAFEALVDTAHVGVTVYPKRNLPRIWVDSTSYGPRDGSLRDALDVVRNDPDFRATRGREMGNGTSNNSNSEAT